MIDVFLKIFPLLSPTQHYFDYFQGGECFCLGHLLIDESMMNSAYVKNTKDDHLYFLFCGFYKNTTYTLIDVSPFATVQDVVIKLNFCCKCVDTSSTEFQRQTSLQGPLIVDFITSNLLVISKPIQRSTIVDKSDNVISMLCQG